MEVGIRAKPLYDFVIGTDRCAFRVAGYATLMTDTYPPFGLDMGGKEPPSSSADDSTLPTPLPA